MGRGRGKGREGDGREGEERVKAPPDVMSGYAYDNNQHLYCVNNVKM